MVESYPHKTVRHAIVRIGRILMRLRYAGNPCSIRSEHENGHRLHERCGWHPSHRPCDRSCLLDLHDLESRMVHVSDERDRWPCRFFSRRDMRNDVPKLVVPVIAPRPSQRLGDVLCGQSLEERSCRARSQTAKNLESALHRQRVRGFKTSLSASPSRFHASTIDHAMTPGASSSHGITRSALIEPAS